MNITFTKLCNLSPITSFFIISLVCLLAPVSSVQAHAKPTPQTSLNTPAEDWQNTTLLIDIAPALCKYEKRYASYRQCKEGDAYVIAGLDLGNNITCHSKTLPKLSPLQSKVVDKIMPDKRTQTRAWQNYAACSNVKDTQYFRQIIQLTDNLILPKILEAGDNYVIHKSDFLNHLSQSNTGLTSQHVHLHCIVPNTNTSKYPVLTKIEICYRGHHFRDCKKQRHSSPNAQSFNTTANTSNHSSSHNCTDTFIISGL